MPDNQGLIKARLGKLGLSTRREEEILRELGEYLEDHAADLEAGGVASDAAAREALDSVSNWPQLRREIHSAETEEANMNYRTKVLWLPALGALILSSSLLAIFQFFGLVPRFYWLNRTGLSMYPFYTFYLPWLIALPAIGAVAAFWSQRAGGQAIHRLLAAMAPSIGMLGFFLIAPFVSFLIRILVPFFTHRPVHGQFGPPNLATWMTWILVLLVSWVLLPGVGLMLGAIPFLRRHQAQS